MYSYVYGQPIYSCCTFGMARMIVCTALFFVSAAEAGSEVFIDSNKLKTL